MKNVTGILTITLGLSFLGACASSEKGTNTVIQPLSTQVGDYRLVVTSKGDDLGKDAVEALKAECPAVMTQLGSVKSSSKNTFKIEVIEVEKVGGFKKFFMGANAGEDLVKINATMAISGKAVAKLTAEGRMATADIFEDSFSKAAKRACEEIVKGFKN